MATRQAAFLRALADHLDAHPVSDVIVHWHGHSPLDLQLTGGEPTIPRLIAWAASLGATEARLQDLQGRIYIFVAGRIGEHDVEVWDATDPRPGLVGRDSITVAELEAAGA